MGTHGSFPLFGGVRHEIPACHETLTNRRSTSKLDRYHLSVRRKSEAVREGFCCRRRSSRSQVARRDSDLARLHGEMLQFGGRVPGRASPQPDRLCPRRSFDARNGWQGASATAARIGQPPVGGRNIGPDQRTSARPRGERSGADARKALRDLHTAPDGGGWRRRKHPATKCVSESKEARISHWTAIRG